MNQLAVLAEQFDVTRRWTLSLIEDLSEREYSVQMREGLQNVHWILGHLVCAEHGLIFVRCLGAPDLDADFINAFKMGQEVRPTGEAPLPGMSRVRHEMDRIHGRAIDAMLSMDPNDLDKPPLGNPHPMFNTRWGVLSHVSRHEAFHAGQIALIRRLLGKPPLR